MVARTLVTMSLVAAACSLGGCLKRTISVTTDPPGALIWINDVEVGRTPLQTDFTFYGDFDVRVRREGYEPIVTHAKANTPIQELPGIDLVAEAAPIRFHNVVKWHWNLVPVAEASGDKEAAEAAVIARAGDLRGRITGPAATAEKPAATKPAEAQPIVPAPEVKANEPASTDDPSAK